MKCECGRKARAKGLCGTCYQRQRRRDLGVKPAIELGNTMAMTVLLPARIYMHLELMADRKHTTKAHIIREIIEQHLR